jgi:hypothetical protein
VAQQPHRYIAARPAASPHPPPGCACLVGTGFALVSAALWLSVDPTRHLDSAKG